jgi:GNAT superfamily N-acetyltransferase
MESGAAEGPRARARTASRADLDGLTRTLTLAFAEDPLWRWAFTDTRALERWWRFLVASALRYPSVFVSGDYDAVSVWIPPDGSELTDDEQAHVPALLGELVGPRAPDVLALLGEFDAAHPHERPHYYLSLLATHPRSRGRGLGIDLLAQNLARVDGERTPAYLESSNADNVPRYERLGFAPAGEFSTPDGSRRVTTMWREARAPT